MTDDDKNENFNISNKQTLLFWKNVKIQEEIKYTPGLWRWLVADSDDYFISSIWFCLFVCLFVLILNVPVNNFSVMSGRSHLFPAITITFRGVNVSLLKDSTRRR